jgi:hypothetical protein
MFKKVKKEGKKKQHLKAGTFTQPATRNAWL